MNAAMSAWVAICIDPIARSLGGALIYRMVKPFAVDSPDGLVVVRELRPIQAHPLDTPSELPPFRKATSTVEAREPPEGCSNLGEGR